MILQAHHLYHIYNQGNNGRVIFFSRENYLFFLKKIKDYILPYADVIAWCLMPNHFHLMVYINNTELNKKNISIEAMTQSHRFNNSSNKKELKRTLNDSIAIMLRSYTRAINKQQNTSGSLFRKKTKAECLNSINGISPVWFNDTGITKINIVDANKQYPQVCFNYIHQNPVKAGLVSKQYQWEFSSFKDYAGMRNGTLINKKTAHEYVDINMNNHL